MRGVSRHKLANKKLYDNPIQLGVNRLLGMYIYDYPKDRGTATTSDPSVTPWIQLATLGTVIWGLNVVFAQIILGITDPPKIPIPFINPNGNKRSLGELSWDLLDR